MGRHFGIFFFVLLTGCSTAGRPLMPTPNVYAGVELFTNLPDVFESTEVELLYVTDRAPETDEEGNLYYGFRRSNSLAAGTTVVDLGREVTWEDLVEASKNESRSIDFDLQLVSTSEFARLPPVPTPFTIVDGKIVEDPDVVTARDEAIGRLQQEVARRLALTPRKDVYLYVHGYHNTFESASFALAELWHFLGREGLPIVYTWPAGFPGLFGYTYDRESSEFTVFHLKQTIRWLSQQPDVENIHLIAHSRGTDVTIAAVRELVLSARGSDDSPKKRFKIANLVLAAPDLDLEVAIQRVAADRIGLEVGQLTMYTSPEDKAIGFAERLFASPRGRLGTLNLSDFDPDELAALESNPGNFTVVNFKGDPEASGFGHDYFRTNPAVSSDLVLLLRYGLKPGEPGRPLEDLGLKFWRIPTGYPDNVSIQ